MEHMSGSSTQGLSAIIVLSGGLTETHRIPFFVKNRLDHAYKLFYQQKGDVIIVSGKTNISRIHDDVRTSEADMMRDYLTKLGVPHEKILCERSSCDVASAAYYIKKDMLPERTISSLHVIASDFEEESIKYVFKKIFQDGYHISFDIIHSQIRAEVMWHFFSLSRQDLVNSKILLRAVRKGDILKLAGKFFTHRLYRERKLGMIRHTASSGITGKRRKAKAHYSLKRIHAVRKEIFAAHGIIEDPHHKTLIADFWSGRFLNFFGRDRHNKLFCLKFALYLKDKKTFAHEIAVSNILLQKGFDFLPNITAEDIRKAPPWYLYEVVNGSMSGMFSKTYSFGDLFYRSNPTPHLISHLKLIRSVRLTTPLIPHWDSKRYKQELTATVTRIGTFVPPEKMTPYMQAQRIFLERSSILDSVTPVLTHADLHPANIIVSHGMLYLIDFEHICTNTIAFDPAFVWVFSWNNERFQHEFIAAFRESLTPEERLEFDRIWPLTKLYIILFLLRFTYVWEYKSGKDSAQMARKILKLRLGEILNTLSG